MAIETRLGEKLADRVGGPDRVLVPLRLVHGQLGRTLQHLPLGGADLAAQLGDPALDLGRDPRPALRDPLPAIRVAAHAGWKPAVRLTLRLTVHLHVFRPSRYDTRCDTRQGWDQMPYMFTSTSARMPRQRAGNSGRRSAPRERRRQNGPRRHRGRWCGRLHGWPLDSSFMGTKEIRLASSIAKTIWERSQSK